MKDRNIVWLDEKRKIASFRYVTGYQKREFLRRERFIRYLQGLVEEGYRFQ